MKGLDLPERFSDVSAHWRCQDFVSLNHSVGIDDKPPSGLYPGILIGGLGFAFTAGPLGSLPLAMVFHWVGNSLFNTIFLILAALGMG